MNPCPLIHLVKNPSIDANTLSINRLLSSPVLTFSKDANIPHLIHQTYKTSDKSKILPERLSLMESWTSNNLPDTTHIIWNDAQIIELAETRFSPEIIATMKRLPLIVQKTDFFRYLVVYEFGGVYADSDTKCLVPAHLWSFDHRHSNVSFIAGHEVCSPRLHYIVGSLRGTCSVHVHCGESMDFCRFSTTSCVKGRY
jgi:mannosyltransferase OCH1-like enzyme